MNRTATARASRAILDRSPFFPLLLHRAKRFGVALGKDVPGTSVAGFLIVPPARFPGHEDFSPLTRPSAV